MDKRESLQRMAALRINIYRQLSLESLQIAHDNGIDVSHWCAYDPNKLMRQVDVAAQEGVSRQAIHKRIQSGQYRTYEMNGIDYIVMPGAKKL